ncbi:MULTISPECIES: ATP-binding protein [unclassified Rhizobium]|uniref:ATP-binding protein n=1 Tax=unclassified Rhizobium TaxID=2613769 RepID=UPI001614A546|nr:MULTISPECIES: ATP-binding protein [unclassified Rhizobium]MBB3386630.1 signal transduction histidine kinase [Rhizobium sp. BK098]MBB3618334.1 signal transduction histidine kinase [Rhizobium sp. BK609]MBB3683991.1 signal transduction histidine kinase [Rhizobium sp. BK612]
MISLRTATASSLSILFTVIAFVFGAVSYAFTMNESSEFLDLQQRQIARYVGDLTFIAPDRAALPPHDSEDDYVIKVNYADGRAAKSSDKSIAIPDRKETGFSEFSDGKRDWRVFSMVTPERSVQVAQQIAVRKELAADAAARATIPFLVAIPLSWILVAFVTGRIFRNLEHLGKELSLKATADTIPVDLSTMPREVWPFVRSMNELIARLAVAFRQQQMFLSDAAHELRTPLSALTLQIGNLSQAKGPDLEERLSELRAGARRVSALTDKLLKISRYEGVPQAGPTHVLDLAETVKDVVSGLLIAAEEKQLDLGFAALADGARVRIDSEDLNTLIETIIDNAVRYTPNGGAVDITVEGGASPLLMVSDNGPGVPDHELPRLTERFYRGSGRNEGTGLGLAIVEAICGRYGLSLKLMNRTDGPGLVVTVGFPAA